MYILHHAFRNVLRNRGRNALVGAIILVIITATVTALMINNTSSGIIDDYKGRFASEVILVANMNRMRAQAMANYTGGKVMIRPPVITPDQYIAFGESEHLYGSFYTAAIGINSVAELAVVDGRLGGGFDRPVLFGTGDVAEPTRYTMNLLGNRFSDFTEGIRAIAQGRMPEELNECIISADLAELNGLSVGDTLYLTSHLEDADRTRHPIYYQLTVVGVYHDATEEYAIGAQRNAYTNRRNEILTGYETVAAPMLPDLRGIQITATYYLKSPDQLEAFAAELYAKGLDPLYDVTTDDATYNRIVGPVEGLKTVSLTFMIIVLVFGGIIIALLSSIAVRERKYEIGVLRAMGLKKHKVILGLWSEMLMITCLCSVLGLLAGAVVAQPVTDVLLQRQIEAAQAPSQQPFAPGGMMIAGAGAGANPSGNPESEPLKNLDLTLGFNTTLQIMGIALLLASFATLVSVSRVTQYEPIKILVERN